MELIIFQMKPRFPEVGKYSGLSMRWIKYGRSVLVSCSTCRPSSSDEQDVIT